MAVFSASAEVSDQVAAELSHDPHFAVIERTQMEALLQESALNQAAKDEGSRALLGKLLGVEVVVHVNIAQKGDWRVDIVHGTSGKLLASGSCAGETAKVVESTRGLLKTLPPSNAEERRRIVVNDFTAPTGKNASQWNAVGGRLAAELRTRLLENGLPVLDRLSITQVASEQTLAEIGLTEVSGTSVPPLLGADWVITGECLPEGETLRLSILDVSGGRLLRQETFPLSAGSGSAGISEPMMKWVIEGIAGEAAAQKFKWTRSAKVEALEPFYRGITLFQEGEFLDAAAEFGKTYEFDKKQVTAYLWEARCYEAAGLQPLADAVRVNLDRWYSNELKGLSATPAATGEGIAFLGVADRAGDPAGCRKLEILTTDAASDGRILLASDLASLRDEYDALVGVKNSRGITWNEAPGFLARRTLAGVLTRRNGCPVLRLCVNDIAKGTLLASEEIVLAAEKEAWRSQIQKPVRALLSRSMAESAKDPTMAPLPPAQEIRARLQHDGNTAVLKLALVDPAMLAESGPLLVKRDWIFQETLNFGLHEYLLAKLPSTDAIRPWLELNQIQPWLSYSDMARIYYTERQEDGLAQLTRFVQAHPDDLPGAVGEYMLLWETMATLPYPELEKRFAALTQRCSQPGKERDPNLTVIARFSEHLRQLAVIAQDDPARRIPLPMTHFPVRLRPEIGKQGRISIVYAGWWEASEWRHFQVSPEDAVHEARAAIAFLGHRRDNFKADPAWIRQFPHSHALLCFIIEMLRAADMNQGLPLRHPFDADAEKAEFREMTAYTFSEIRREIQNASTPAELDQLEAYEIRRFLTSLVHTGYARTVPDEEFTSMRETLAGDVAQAEQRLGRTQRQNYRPIWLDWRKIDRASTPFLNPKISRQDQESVYDEAAMKEQAAQAAARPPGARLFDTEWVQLMRRYDYVSQPSEKRAEDYLAQFPRLRSETGPLHEREMRMMLEFAHTLYFKGQRAAEAEELFRRVYDTKVGDSPAVADLRANAAFDLARVLSQWGRKPEAVALLKEVLAIGRDHPIPFVEDGAWHAVSQESVQSAAMRRLAELREEKSSDSTPVAPNTVKVKSSDAPSGELSYEFRPPAGCVPGSEGSYRVLLLGNADDKNSWGRFADENGLFLVAMRHRNPEAMVQALAKIRKQYPIVTDRLLLHGHHGGARTVEEFALSKPELCAVVSVHCETNLLWEELLPAEFHPLSDLKGVPFLATCGTNKESDDWRYNRMVRFVTMARGAGIPVVWKELPHTRCFVSPELDKTAQMFLADFLKEGKDRFVGNLLTGTYYPGGDARIATIPKHLQVQLPGRTFAELWGKEAPQ